MQAFVSAVRNQSGTVIWAPSDVTQAYPASSCKARANTLALPNVTLPASTPLPLPARPLGITTDGGCDTSCRQYAAWDSQIATLKIHDTDYLIAADLPGAP